MKGKAYGSLLVLSEDGIYKNHDVIWLCQCKCGNRVTVRSSYLRSGHTKTCGKRPEKFEFFDDCIKCTVASGRSFIFDIEDIFIVRQYRWSVTENGYALGVHKITKEKVKLHRLLLKNPSVVVDHINGNAWDNRKSNLRAVTQHQNTQNSATPKSSTTGYKGVCMDKRRGKYMAHIHPNGKTKFLGYYDNPIDAAIAYDKAALIYYGEFARLNFPIKIEEREEKSA